MWCYDTAVCRSAGGQLGLRNNGFQQSRRVITYVWFARAMLSVVYIIWRESTNAAFACDAAKATSNRCIFV